MNCCSYVSEEFFKDAAFVKRLGGGGYGDVELIRKKNNVEYAVKYLKDFGDPTENCVSRGIDSTTIWDMDSLIRFRDCDDVVHLYGACIQKGRVALIMEPMDLDLHGLMYTLSQKARDMLGQKLLHFLIRSAATMEYFNIVHFDIKPGNILVKLTDSGCEFKMTDFGLSRITYTNRTVDLDSVYTLPYATPESYSGRLNRKYYHKGDIWSIGITMLDWYSGQCLFNGLEPIDVLDQIRKFYNLDISLEEFITGIRDESIRGRLSIKHLVPPDMYQEISSMLDIDPESRPDAATILHAHGGEINLDLIKSMRIKEDAPREILPEGVREILRLSREGICNMALMAVEIYTRYTTINMKREMEYALASVWISNKYNEEHQHTLCDIQRKSFYKKTRKCIVEAERSILKTLGFIVYNIDLTRVIRRMSTAPFRILNATPSEFVDPVEYWFL